MGDGKDYESARRYGDGCSSVTLVGVVGADPEQRQAKGNGSKFTILSVATQRSLEERRRRMGLCDDDRDDGDGNDDGDGGSDADLEAKSKNENETTGIRISQSTT
jgi:hypothetical protein